MDTPIIPNDADKMDNDAKDTFASIFTESIVAGPEVSEDVVTDPAPVPVTPEPQKSDNEVAEERYRYHQSRADKAEAQLRELEYVKPVADILAERQDIAETIESMLKKQDPEPVKETLQKPTPPSKPEDFDTMSAMSDPSSSSGKYLKAYQEYQEQVVNYLEQKDALRERVLQEREQKALAKEQEGQKMARVRVDLAKRGLTPSEAEEFLKFSSNPRVELDTVLSVWRASKKDPAAEAEKLKKEAELKRRNERSLTPLPGIGGGGNPVTEPTGDESEQFSDSLIAYANRYKKTK
jgi:hypothetical protein